MRPETFEDELQRRLGRHYRLRWAVDKDVWCIEHGVEVPLGAVPESMRGRDVWIRARDHVMLVCEVSPRPYLTCPHCRVTRLALPVLEWREVRCGYCRTQPYKPNTTLVAAYFPLGERLLQHLESTAPRFALENVRRMHAANDALRASQERDLDRHIDAGLRDYRNVIAGNPVVGAGAGPATYGAGHRH